MHAKELKKIGWMFMLFGIIATGLIPFFDFPEMLFAVLIGPSFILFPLALLFKHWRQDNMTRPIKQKSSPIQQRIYLV